MQIKFTKKSSCLPFIFLLFTIFTFSAQEKLETTYLRPSITTFYISPSDYNEINVVKKLIANSSVEARFDKHTVDFDNLTLDYPEKIKKVYFPDPPKKPDSTASAREKKQNSYYD